MCNIGKHSSCISPQLTYYRTALSEDCKKNLNLPLSLNLELDKVCSSREEQRHVETVESTPRKGLNHTNIHCLIIFNADVPDLCDGYCFVTVGETYVYIEIDDRMGTEAIELKVDDTLEELYSQYG